MTGVWILSALVFLLASGVVEGGCRYGPKVLKAGQETLNPRCSLKMKCNSNGRITGGLYRCPANTHCAKFHCKCKGGFVTATQSNGLVTSCRRGNACMQGGKAYANGKEWLSGNCRYRYVCSGGRVLGGYNHRCPQESRCVRGKCHCKTNWLVKSRKPTGLLTACRPKWCTYSGRKHGYNKVFPNSRCNGKLKCHGGFVRNYGRYSCPANSRCVKGMCQCNANFERGSVDNDFLLTACRNIVCRYEGRIYQNNAEWYTQGCGQILKCEGGKVRTVVYGHRCPANSRCDRQQCKCNDKYMVGVKRGMRVLSCKPTFCKQGIHTYQDGQEWLRNYCDKKYKCVKGSTQEVSHTCPESSECMYGECRCKHGARTKSNGIVTACNGATCRHGGKTYQFGDIWLTNHCRKKLTCREHGVREAGSYLCPYKSRCVSEKCRCYYHWSPKRTDKHGFIFDCYYTKCQYKGSWYAHGVEFLAEGCTHRIACEKGKIDVYGFSCPSNSKCVAKKCVCNAGYKVTAKTNKGIVTRCGR